MTLGICPRGSEEVTKLDGNSSPHSPWLGIYDRAVTTFQLWVGRATNYRLIPSSLCPQWKTGLNLKATIPVGEQKAPLYSHTEIRFSFSVDLMSILNAIREVRS